MIDRTIAIVGLALALIFGVVQYYVPLLPSWAALCIAGIGVLLFGISIGMWIPRVQKARLTEQPVERADLRLHTYADHRAPEKISLTNIFRWYYFRHGLTPVVAGDQAETTYLSTTLFVTFDKEVQVSTLKVRSPNIPLPPYDVKEFNQRYAIVVFQGGLPEGTLELSVEP